MGHARAHASLDAHSRRQRRLGLLCRPVGLRLVEPDLQSRRALLNNMEQEQHRYAVAGRCLHISVLTSFS